MHSSSSILSNKKGSEAYHNFINSLSSSVTKTEYSKWFGYYIQYLNKQRDDEDYDMLLQESPKLIQSRIIDFIVYMKDTKKLTPATIKSYVAAIRHFYDIRRLSYRSSKKSPFVVLSAKKLN